MSQAVPTHPADTYQEGAGVQVSDLSRHDVVVILSNAPDMLLAKRIVHMLVEERLAACVNLGAPGLSMYMWQDTLEGAEEIPITIKTTGSRAQALIERLRALHPYEVPEVLVLPVLGGTDDYLAWVRAQVQD